MKYWKQGFYDEPQEGSIEITEGYYQKLLAGQSAGLEILESKKGYPILVEPQYSLEDVIKNKVSEIQVFDKSECVNSFELSGRSMWLDKSTRVGLFNSISIEKQIGKSDTVLWYDAIKVYHSHSRCFSNGKCFRAICIKLLQCDTITHRSSQVVTDY